MWKNTVAKIKNHVVKHQVEYMIGGTFVACYAVGSGIKHYSQRPKIASSTSPQLPSGSPPQFTNIFAPVNNNENVVNLGGPATKIVKRLSDGKIWEEQGEAALELAAEKGISLEYARNLISRNANGHKDHVFGDQFRFIGQSTKGTQLA